MQESDFESMVSRREFGGVAVTGTLSPLFMGSSSDGPFTPLAAEFVRSRSGWNLSAFGPNVAKYGGHPSWTVSVSEGDLPSLLNWVESADSRGIIHQSSTTDTATIAAPTSEVAGDTFGEGLADLSYVEWIDLNTTISNVQPPELPGSETAHPQFSTFQKVVMDADPAPVTGLAFDAETSTLDASRQTVADTEVSQTGSGFTLGVIDTGLNYDKDYFGSRVVDASVNLTDAEKPTYGAMGADAIADGNGHGTWVTAAAAASPPDSTYDGVATGADILSIKALDDEGSGKTATIAHAIRYAVDNGANSLCMSLGSPVYSKDMADAIEYATSEGVLVVVAAGNDRTGTRFVNYPAADPNTLAVSATTTGAPAEVRSAHFANVGPSPGTTNFSEGATAGAEVGIAAPGMALEADLPNGYSTLSGTSMAAPFPAAAALVVLEADGALENDADGLRKRLEATAEPAEHLAAAETAHGVLDIKAAVEGSEPETDQPDVMNSKAESRDSGYRAESAARGGLVTRYFFGGGE